MYNILVCDDEKDIVSALHIYLSSEGYAVVPAYSGKQALEIMQEQSIDLVLMDIMMPEMDGLTAVAKLREFSNVPVLFLTAKDRVRLLPALNIPMEHLATAIAVIKVACK